MKDIHRRYLEIMGVQIWERRRTPEPPKDRPLAVAAATPPEAPEDLSAPAPSARRDDQPPPPPASSEIPEEYLQWAMTMDEEGDLDPDCGLDPLPLNDREARIARMGWDELEAEVKQCTACELHKTRTQGVFGVGNRKAEWMIVGEAPGADEDRLGEPFVGRAGKLLDTMLLALGLNRERVYIANILKSRPPNNRDPRPEEVRACWPYLQRQVELIQPKILLAVGRIAAQNLLQTDVNIGKLRGQVYRFGETGIPLVVTYHPAYLLRSPGQKRKAWEDLQLALRVLQGAER